MQKFSITHVAPSSCDMMEYYISDCDRCPVTGSEWILILHREDAFCLLCVPNTFSISVLHQQVI